VPLETTHVLQTNSGSTGATTSTTVTVSLPGAVTRGSVVLVAIGQTSSDGGISDPGGGGANFWANNIETASAFGIAACGYGTVFTMAADVTTSSWAFTFPSDAVCWAAAEISGKALLLTDENFGAAYEGNIYTSAASGTSGTTIDTGQGTASTYPDVLLVAAFVGRVASGTPPAFDSCADTTVTPETVPWTQLGSSVATSTGGANCRLDLFYKGLKGVGPADATGTWASAVAGRTGMIGSYRTITQRTVETATFGQTMAG
jgi:hypothetical protein